MNDASPLKIATDKNLLQSSDEGVLEEIVQKTEEKKSTAAAEIKNTLEWTRGFFGKRDRPDPSRVPPGQYVTHDFPVLTAGPTEVVPTDRWQLTVGDGDTLRRMLETEPSLAASR